MFQAPARVGSRSRSLRCRRALEPSPRRRLSRCLPPARTQHPPPPTAAAAAATSSHRPPRWPVGPAPAGPTPPLARPPAPNSSKQNVPFTTPRSAPRMRRPACGPLGCREPGSSRRAALFPWLTRGPLTVGPPCGDLPGPWRWSGPRDSFLSTVWNFWTSQSRGVNQNCDLNARKFKSLGTLRLQTEGDGCKTCNSKTKGGIRPEHPTESRS